MRRIRDAGGRCANLVGSNSADDADEDSDEHANDKADDDHELVVLRRRGEGGDERPREQTERGRTCQHIAFLRFVAFFLNACAGGV